MFSGHLSWLFTSSQQTPTAFVLVSSQLHLSLFVEKSEQSVIPQSFQPLIPGTRIAPKFTAVWALRESADKIIAKCCRAIWPAVLFDVAADTTEPPLLRCRSLRCSAWHGMPWTKRGVFDEVGLVAVCNPIMACPKKMGYRGGSMVS